MTAYNNVLIALDCEGQPDQVLAGASKYINAATNVLVLNAAFDPSYIYASYSAAGFMNSASDSIADQVRIHTHDEIRKLLMHSKINDAKISVELGRACDMIINKAEAMQADLIIIGSHGRHGLRTLLGSTANAVLHRAKCDVLAVKIDDDNSANKTKTSY
jgi:universal stress protein A